MKVHERTKAKGAPNPVVFFMPKKNSVHICRCRSAIYRLLNFKVVLNLPFFWQGLSTLKLGKAI